MTPPPRRSLNPLWWKVGGAVVAGAAAVAALVAMQQPTHATFGKVVVIENIDADVAGNGLDSATGEANVAASRLAAQGGGTLAVLAASGGAAQTVATADLKVDREGQTETDPQVRDMVVAQRVASTLAAARRAAPTTPGRDLLSLLSAAANQAPGHGQPFTVIYVGFGLGTVDPADARVSIAGEPGQAVDGINSQLPKLPGAQLYAVFPAAAGPQPALNPATSAWRKEYWTRLALAMGANLADVTTDTPPSPPAVGAPAAPVIPNIPDPTPVPPSRPGQPPRPDPAPVVLAGSSFLPDSDQFVDPTAAAQALAPLASAWTQHANAYAGAECTGRTAAYGPAGTARALSQQRADRVASLLKNGGVTSVTATGVGFGAPLPQYSPTDPHQRSVVCQLIPRS